MCGRVGPGDSSRPQDCHVVVGLNLASSPSLPGLSLTLISQGEKGRPAASRPEHGTLGYKIVTVTREGCPSHFL